MKCWEIVADELSRAFSTGDYSRSLTILFKSNRC